MKQINQVYWLLSRKTMGCNSGQFKVNLIYNWKIMDLFKGTLQSVRGSQDILTHMYNILVVHSNCAHRSLINN